MSNPPLSCNDHLINKDSNAKTACSITGLEGNIDGSIITGCTVVKSPSLLLFNIIRFDGSLDGLYPILFLIRIDMYELI